MYVIHNNNLMEVQEFKANFLEDHVNYSYVHMGKYYVGEVEGNRSTLFNIAKNNCLDLSLTEVPSNVEALYWCWSNLPIKVRDRFRDRNEQWASALKNKETEIVSKYATDIACDMISLLELEHMKPELYEPRKRLQIMCTATAEYRAWISNINMSKTDEAKLAVAISRIDVPNSSLGAWNLIKNGTVLDTECRNFLIKIAGLKEIPLTYSEFQKSQKAQKVKRALYLAQNTMILNSLHKLGE